MRIALLLDHAGSSDSRVARTVSALQELGYDARVFACVPQTVDVAGLIELYGEPDFPRNVVTFDPRLTVPGVAMLKRMRGLAPIVPTIPGHESGPRRTPPAQSWMRSWKQTLGIWLSAGVMTRALLPEVRDFSPDIVHANDLSTLNAGAAIAEACSAKLVYDSHEYENGRNLELSPLQSRIRRRREAAGLAHADAVITVSESIADTLMRDYGITRPTVVLNTPSHLENADPKPRDPGPVLHVVHIGGMQAGRGIRTLIDAVSRARRPVRLTLLGGVQSARETELREHAKHGGQPDRIIFAPPVRQEQLMQRLAEFDASVIALPAVRPSYDMSMPNKLFESLAAGLPIISVPLVEASRFLELTRSGLSVEAASPEALANGFERMADRLPWRVTLPEPYGWPAQKLRLQALYAALANGEAIPEPEPLPHWS